MSKNTDLQYRRKWGIPDWRDGAAYPATLPEMLWRWEFLRRAKEYRDDWERSYLNTVKWYQEHPLEDFFRKPPSTRGPICSESWNPSPCGDGRVFFGNWEIKPESPDFRVHMLDSIKKYGLYFLINPAIAQPATLYFLSSEVCLLDPQYMPDLRSVSHCQLVLALNPGVGMKEHIKVLRAGLEMLRERLRCPTPKPHTGEWADYLRALDAKAIRVKNKEIWQVLRPNMMAYNPDSRAGDLIRAAKKLQKKLIRPTK